MKIIIAIILTFSIINAFQVMSFDNYKKTEEIKKELKETDSKIIALKGDILELNEFIKNDILDKIIFDVQKKVYELEAKKTSLNKKLVESQKVAFNN